MNVLAQDEIGRVEAEETIARSRRVELVVARFLRVGQALAFESNFRA